MARLPRLSLAGWPHLLLWRGQQGVDLFPQAVEAAEFVQRLQALAQAQRVLVHGYGLEAQQVALLLTPLDEAAALARLMQALGRDSVRAYNRRHGRSGTLWQGRYGSAVLADAPAVLEALLYCAQACGAPRTGAAAGAAAGAVAGAGAGGTGLPSPVERSVPGRRLPPEPNWPPNSHGHYAGSAQLPFLHAPTAYWQLGNTPFERQAAYSALAALGLSAAQRQRLEQAALHGWALGSAAALAELQTQTPRRVQPARAGRPALTR